MEVDKLDKIRDNMLTNYMELQLDYIEFTKYVENKINNIITEKNIVYQTISSRVKNYKSLEKKLTESIINGIHKNIKNLNDLSGIRVIFYDEHELKRIYEILNKNFIIDNTKYPDNIIEYDGINVTLSLKEKINKFSDMKCELQLTTLMSHAMNEFGHNVLYKDVLELESKNKNEYDNIKNIFNDTRIKVLEVMKTLEFINHRIDSLKNGSLTLELIVNPMFVESIKSINNLEEVEITINKLIEVIPLINNDEININKIIDSNIILEIVKKFISLPEENESGINYDTYDYKFDKLFEFLLRYMYLWVKDYQEIINILYLKVNSLKKTRVKDNFKKFLKDCLINDKVNSHRKIANFQLHNLAYKYIMKSQKETYPEVKMILATEFCNFKYSFCEETGPMQVNIVMTALEPNEAYKLKIKNVVKKCCSIFIKEQTIDNFNKLVSIVKSNVDTETDSFKIVEVYDFFENNYDKIDDYYKSELYKNTYFIKKAKIKDSNFYKKLKFDRTHILYSYLFCNFIDEIPGAKYREREEYREKFLNSYIEHFNIDNVEEAIKIINILEVHKKDIKNLNVVSRFLIKIGEKIELSKQIYEKTRNSYILVGIVNVESTYEINLRNEEEIKNLTEAIYYSQTYNNDLIKVLSKYVKESKNHLLYKEFIRLVFDSIELFQITDYRNQVLDELTIANKKCIDMMEYIFIRPDVEEYIINNLCLEEIKIIINNTKFNTISYLNESFYESVFEKYPEVIRNFIEEQVENEQEDKYYNNDYSLKECSNYKEELENNLMLCIKILNKKPFYKVSQFVRYLLGDFDNDIEKKLINILSNKNDNATLKSILNICRILSVSVDGWHIYEKIIELLDADDKLLREISCLLFDTGVVSGEYGIANSFKSKYDFLKTIKSKNENVNLFVKNQIKRFEALYKSEKMETDKEIIKRRVEYELDHKKEENTNKTDEI